MSDEEIKLKKKKKKKKIFDEDGVEIIKKKKKKKKKDDLKLLEQKIARLESELDKKSKFDKFDKKDQFVKKKKSNNKAIYIGAVFLLIILASVFLGLGKSSGNKTKRPKNFGAQPYTSKVSMTEINAKEESGGKISISLSEVQRDLFVLFKYDKNKVENRSFGTQGLPLLSYISPNGDLVVAVSMCEPCKSIRFRIEPDGTLTCLACGTKFDMETLAGISGACVQYPPDEVKYTIQGDKIMVDPFQKMASGKTVATWKPRI